MLELSYESYIDVTGNIHVIRLEYEVNVFYLKIRKNQDKNTPAVNISTTDLQLRIY